MINLIIKYNHNTSLKIIVGTMYMYAHVYYNKLHSAWHGVRHGFKIGGAKTIIELESEPMFNINL